MITVYGEGRGFRVIWMLEEMGLPHRLVNIDLLSGEVHDPDFLKINPSGFIPALRDGEVAMVESIAMLEYLAARHGPTPLVPLTNDPTFPAYKQFLLLGEAGLATAAFYFLNLRRLSQHAAEDTPQIGFVRHQIDSRLALVIRQLRSTPYIAGAGFTAADISVAYGLNLVQYGCGLTFEETVRDYLARVRTRPAYARALETCQATKGFYRSRSD